MTQHPYLRRILHNKLEARLAAFPVVVVTGARQTGKTTLVRELGGDARSYLTLDDYDVLDQARNAPDQLLTRSRLPLTLDEVQRAPDLLLAVKRAVDEDRTPGRFLLTGSANLSLMESVAETMAGRAVYAALLPMTRQEAAGRGSAGQWDAFVDRPPADWLSALTPEDGAPAGDAPPSRPRLATPPSWEELTLRGGYPTPALHLASAEDRAAWFEGYVATYLERDLRQLSAIANLVGFQRLVRAAALRLGGLMNQADLARDVGLAPSTAQRYLHLLETSYQLTRVETYATTGTRRLVKSPKLYWNDVGLALHLAGSDRPGGAHLENLVLVDLLAWRETRTPRPRILYWRTRGGAEVDFVVETPNVVVPVEVKSARRARTADARHLAAFMEQHGRLARAGVLIYGGVETYWLTDRVLAVPWHAVL